MKYINNQNQTTTVQPVGYTTSETGNVNQFKDDTVLSSTYNQCYFVFNNHLDIKKIENIKLKQELPIIKARMVFAESVDWGGQHVNFGYAKAESKIVERDLPIPEGTVIRVKKVDSDNGAELKNAQFVLKNLSTGQYAVGGRNTSQNNTWTTNIANATTYQSGDKILLEKAGTYQFYEVKAQNEYYKACSKTEAGKLAIGSQIAVSVGNSYDITLKNQPLGYVILNKIDDTRKNELNNTRFVIKRIDTGQYAKGGTGQNQIATWVNNINQATIYTPKQRICFEQKVNYQIYEVQRQNDSYAYCSISQPLAVGGTKTVVYRTTKTETITNRRKYIKISGYIWEDLMDVEKGSKYDNLYNTNVAPDKKVANVQVILKDKNGKILNTRANGQAIATTNGAGEYIFKEIEIEQLKNGAYVEFTYNGMAYKSVKINPNLANGSKASDETRRGDFNNKFATITKNQATASNGATTNLSYKQNNGISALDYEGGAYGYSGQKYPVSKTANKYEITANTKGTGFLGQTIYTLNDIYIKGLDEIANINLGIVEKEQPDLSLVKDIDKIEVDINGKPHIYKYADRFNPKLYAENGGNGYEMNSQVKFGTKYGGMSYTRALYASDIYHNEMEGRNPENDLQVKVTYKIGIKNTSSTLTAVVNEIDDYYNNKYKVLNITKQENGNTSKLNVNTPTKENNEYNKTKINNMNLKIKPNGEGYVFVELEIEQNQIVEIIDNKSKLDNIAEISSYSIKDSTGKAYAGIDQDSNPGNIVIGQTNTYEDDTDKAPGLELTLQEPRKVNGKVFLDSTTGELKTGEIREGDGEYKEEER